MLGISRDDDFGLCVRARRDCIEGTVIERFDGNVGTLVSQHSLQIRPGLHISGTRHIGFLSHGCDPNCRLDMTHFELVALRRIRNGELLTIDYSETEDRLFAQFACICGSTRCRRWITGRNEAATPTGQRFLAALTRVPA
ncbi:MAG: SET domain-containing protein [Sphingopyxis sp.]|uniref:SET domain-containing protein n=1 Tax=Sphingopyxis sp. TaxID=1908224 RepID=UPI002ABB6B8B|nr:SET domain-containing protein [Sphingopyxis sp.]MDZ3832709.1 SET domain-containing protein [Sphingopyxis sp.]